MNSRIIFKNLSKLNVIYVSKAFKVNQTLRTSRFLGKLVSGGSKRSRWFPNEPKAATVNIFTNPKGSGKTTSRRQAVLNHVFMTHIVELMSTGQYASEIQEEKISVTKVKVHPDYKGVNIYWYKKSGVPNEDTDKFLQKISGYLRREMCALQVIGIVPPISFVKDKTCFHESEIISLLQVADFPDDYKPLGSPDAIKSDLGYEDVMGTNLNEEEEPLPEMKNNVFGLDHSKIMNRIENEVSERILVHSGDRETLQISNPKDQSVIDFDKKDYSTYLRKRREARALAAESIEYERPGNKWEEESEWEDKSEDHDEYEYENEYEYEEKDEYEYEEKDEYEDKDKERK